jgi:hypothetical protein
VFVLWDFLKRPMVVVSAGVGCARSLPADSLICLEILLMENCMYGHRRKGKHLGRGHSRKMFSGVAQWIHPVNAHREPMRGGFRL